MSNEQSASSNANSHKDSPLVVAVYFFILIFFIALSFHFYDKQRDETVRSSAEVLSAAKITKASDCERAFLMSPKFVENNALRRPLTVMDLEDASSFCQRDPDAEKLVVKARQMESLRGAGRE